MYDRLIFILVFGLVALLVGIACLSYIAWINAGSRNLALATAALDAALFLLLIQLPFELQGRTDTDFFTAEFTVNRSKPEIRQWSYPEDVGWRIGQEINASSALAKATPEAFSGDRTKLEIDMTLFSLTAYLLSEQLDWQLKHVRLKGKSTGTLTSTQPMSKPEECTVVTFDELRNKLTAIENLFANSLPFSGRQLCLPVGSSIQIQTASLTLANPFCKISFVLEPSNFVSYTKPGSGGERSNLPNGEAEFETRLTGVRTTVEYAWIRAQHRDKDKYRDWTERVIRGARHWFEGATE